jgi:hypothetical protein
MRSKPSFYWKGRALPPVPAQQKQQTTHKPHTPVLTSPTSTPEAANVSAGVQEDMTFCLAQSLSLRRHQKGSAHPNRGALLGSWFRKQKPGLMHPPPLPSSWRLDCTCMRCEGVSLSAIAQHRHNILQERFTCLYVTSRSCCLMFSGTTMPSAWATPVLMQNTCQGCERTLHGTGPTWHLQC